jgi:hypothetical protein
MTDRITAEPQVDVHVSVLAALDQHLAMLQGIRTELTAVRATAPGTRLDLISDSALSARQYVDLVESTLAALIEVGGSEAVSPLASAG